MGDLLSQRSFQITLEGRNLFLSSSLLLTAHTQANGGNRQSLPIRP